MLKVIEDAAAIAKCQSLLKAKVNAVSTEKASHTVGFPGGTATAMIYYVGELDFWMTFKPIGNRYWNCAGLGYPFGSKSSVAPHVEINPPRSGIARSIAGAFLEDEEGVLYIGHNGKVGGGAKGVSKTNFLLYYPAWSLALSGEKEIPMFVIGRLDNDRLPRQLRDFTRVSAEFRHLIKQGKTPGVVNEPTSLPHFTPEFEGTKTYHTADIVEANCTHGTVVKAVREALAERGIQTFSTQKCDLYVLGEDGKMSVLFELKSGIDSTSIYGAVGQLMFHGGAGTVKRLVAILPKDVVPDTVQRLNELGIEVVTFSIDEDGQVALSNIDGVAGEASRISKRRSGVIRRRSSIRPE